MTAYIVTLAGCDDSTSVELDLDPLQHALVALIAAKTQVEGGGCKPIMRLRTPDQLDPWERETDDDY